MTLKLAFTTLGCPDWDLPAILENARRYGYQGIDFRGYLGDMAVQKRREFTTEKAKTARRIADAGLEVTGFSTGAALMPTANKPVKESLEEVKAYADLCPTFKTPYLRVFGQAIGDRTWEDAIGIAADTLRQMAEIAAPNNTAVIVETHDAWVRSEHIRPLMERVDLPNVGVLWDIHHPWRAGESPAETWESLHPWIAYTHWKDATLPDHDLCLPGDGDLPLRECVDVLRRGGYSGYYTLEWEKKWHPELADPEIAFPRFADVMKQYAQ